MATRKILITHVVPIMLILDSIKWDRCPILEIRNQVQRLV